MDIEAIDGGGGNPKGLFIPNQVCCLLRAAPLILFLCRLRIDPPVWHPLRNKISEKLPLPKVGGGEAYERCTRTDALCPLTCLMFTFAQETNRSKTEIQKELSLLHALVELFKDPLEKEAGLEAHLPSRRRAGLEQQLLPPRHSTCSCLRRDAARSWREIPGAGSPRDPPRRRRRSERAGASDPPVRGVTAALAGGGFKRRSPRSAGGSAPPSPF